MIDNKNVSDLKDWIREKAEKICNELYGAWAHPKHIKVIETAFLDFASEIRKEERERTIRECADIANRISDGNCTEQTIRNVILTLLDQSQWDK